MLFRNILVTTCQKYSLIRSAGAREGTKFDHNLASKSAEDDLTGFEPFVKEPECGTVFHIFSEFFHEQLWNT